MKSMLIPALLLGANAFAAAPVAVIQAQPLAATPLLAAAQSKAAAAQRIVVTPKIHETVATVRADGTLDIGCTERVNPAAQSPAILAPVPRLEQ